MSKDTTLQLRVGTDFKDKVQALADSNYMTLTAAVVRALVQTYPELRPRTLDPKPTPLQVTREAMEHGEMPESWKPSVRSGKKAAERIKNSDAGLAPLKPQADLTNKPKSMFKSKDKK